MAALNEIYRALFSVQIWWAIAVEDVIGRYRRTILGPLWLVISQAAWILGIYLLHRSLFGAEQKNFLLYLAAGLPVWSLISGGIVDGTQAFLRSKGYIESYPLPMPLYIVRIVAGAYVTFAHLIVVYFVTAALTMTPPGFAIVAALPGLAIIGLFNFGVALGLAPLGARFRDLGPALTSLMSLLFILTPVFYAPTAQQLASPMVAYNPFYHMLEIVRAPLLGTWGTPQNWVFSVSFALISLVIGGFIYARMRPTVAYWL